MKMLTLTFLEALSNQCESGIQLFQGWDLHLNTTLGNSYKTTFLSCVANGMIMILLTEVCTDAAEKYDRCGD